MRGRILNRTFGRMAEATRVALQETYPTDYSFRPLLLGALLWAPSFIVPVTRIHGPTLNQ